MFKSPQTKASHDEFPQNLPLFIAFALSILVLQHEASAQSGTRGGYLPSSPAPAASTYSVPAQVYAAPAPTYSSANVIGAQSVHSVRPIYQGNFYSYRPAERADGASRFK